MQELTGIIAEFKNALPDADKIMTDDVDVFDKLG